MGVAARGSREVTEQNNDAGFTKEEGRQLFDVTNRIRAIIGEFSGKGALQGLVIGQMLAELLASCEEELRPAMMDYVVEEARDRVPINERLLEELWRQEAQ